MSSDQNLFVEPVDENLLCGICFEVMDTPVVVCVKGHTFCQECLREAKQRSRSCPSCRGAVLSPAPVNLFVQTTISSLQMRCEFCGEEDSRKNLSGYVSGPEGQRPTGHYKTCPKLPVTCEFFDFGCRAELSRETIAAHYAENTEYHAGLVRQELGSVRQELGSVRQELGSARQELGSARQELEQANRRTGYAHIDIRWKIPTSELTGSSYKCLMSTIAQVEGRYMFLKLYLGRQNEAIGVSICSAAGDGTCKIKNIQVDIRSEGRHFDTFFGYKDECTLLRILSFEPRYEFAVPRVRRDNNQDQQSSSLESTTRNSEEASDNVFTAFVLPNDSDSSDGDPDDNSEDDSNEASDEQQEGNEVELTRSELIGRARNGRVAISAEFLIQTSALIKKVECRR